MHSRATDRRSASKCQGKWPDQTLDQAFGLSEVLVAVSTSRLSCKSAGKPRTLMPVWDSSGESRLKLVVDRAKVFFRDPEGETGLQFPVRRKRLELVRTRPTIQLVVLLDCTASTHIGSLKSGPVRV